MIYLETDDLRDSREVAFQAALLYTSSRGERRIRVHTLCLPTSASVSEIINGADQAAVVGMLAKFAADRAISDSIADAKEGEKMLHGIQISELMGDGVKSFNKEITTLYSFRSCGIVC